MFFRRRRQNNERKEELRYPVVYAETWPPIFGVRQNLPTPIIMFGTGRARTDLELRVEKNKEMKTFLIGYVNDNELIRMEVNYCDDIIEAGKEMKRFEQLLNTQTVYKNRLQDGVCNPLRTADARIHRFLSDLCWMTQYGE